MNDQMKHKKAARAVSPISPGDLYEDCAYHPCLCVSVDFSSDTILGISLIDGSHPRNCSLKHCGVRKLNVPEAWEIKQNGPTDVTARGEIPKEKRWW